MSYVKKARSFFFKYFHKYLYIYVRISWKTISQVIIMAAFNDRGTRKKGWHLYQMYLSDIISSTIYYLKNTLPSFEIFLCFDPILTCFLSENIF